jgi:hypothetical protein
LKKKNGDGKPYYGCSKRRPRRLLQQLRDGWRNMVERVEVELVKLRIERETIRVNE